MNVFYRAYARAYQSALKLGIAMLRIPYPRRFASLEEMGETLAKEGFRRLLLVTDKGLSSLPSFARLDESLRSFGIETAIYDGAVPNPTFACVEAGKEAYLAERCDGIVAFGGGSPIDCAKSIAIRLAYPNKSLQKFKGVLHVHRRLPRLVAVPTTVGTGSEATLAAVVLNEATKDKFQIDSPRLVPNDALLEPEFVRNLPRKLIATTGMDALTHALEAYLGRGGNRKTDALALSAMRRIAAHLEPLYRDPSSLEHAKEMQLAAYEAGAAFTRAFVGYVHALAHALGGAHGVPHGLANAVLLVPTLRKYGDSIEKKMANIAPIFGVEERDPRLAASLAIERISALERALDIPLSFAGLKEEADVPSLARHAAKEGNPFYPVPKILSSDELSEILEETLS